MPAGEEVALPGVAAVAQWRRAAPVRTVAQAFLAAVRRHGSREAAKPVGLPPITYGELATRVRAMVAVFGRLGLVQGDRLAICLPNGVEWITLTYAAALAGLCIVPLNIRYRAEELAHALKLSQARALFTRHSFMSNQFLERLKEIGGGTIGNGTTAAICRLPDLENVVLFEAKHEAGTHAFDALLHSAEREGLVDLEALASQRLPTEPLWLFWTSGTTSSPKGALLPQSSIVNVWKWTSLAGYASSDRVLTSRPLFYIAGHFWCMLGPMLHGACVVIGTQFTPSEIIELCRAERVTVLSGNPLLLKATINDPGFDSKAFDHVRLGYFGGSALPQDEIEEIRRAIGYRHLVQTYGMTELGGFATSTLPDDPIAETCATCGIPFSDMELKLVDPSGEPVEDGAVGLLMTRGQPLLKYVGLSPEESSKLLDANGWFNTGDLMRRTPQGRYEFVGRTKDLIKVGGENVAAAEIEAELMRHPDVSLAAVIPFPDAQRGEVPIAFVQTHKDLPLEEPELRAWCRRRMAPFKVPMRFHFILAAHWPMTATGKIAKHELLDKAPK